MKPRRAMALLITEHTFLVMAAGPLEEETAGLLTAELTKTAGVASRFGAPARYPTEEIT